MIKSRYLVLFFCLASWLMQAQTVTKFEGIDASNDPHPEHDVDPNGAIGTMQYMEWANVSYQAWSKTPPFKSVWPKPQLGTTPWTTNGQKSCEVIGGDGLINFDRLASRWIIAAHSNIDASGNYYFCVAVSSTDDLSSSTLKWYTYEFLLNPALGTTKGKPNFPDWPKIGTSADAYYVGMDILNPDNFSFLGVLACALDRTNILTDSTPRSMQCIAVTNPDPYLYHGLEPADVEGTTPPPVDQDEMFVSIQNPPRDGKSTTSTSINLWDFQLDPNWSGNSKLVQSSLTVPAFTPGCYTAGKPADTVCVPQPAVKSNGSHYLIDSLGDRMMPRLAYRNFGSYQSWLISHTVRAGTGTSQQTGIGWYELRGNGVPTLFQSGTVTPDKVIYRFMPSIAQDHDGNAAVGYSVSSTTIDPGIRASWWSLTSNGKPVEVDIQNGGGSEENSALWGDYSSMTVDPVDDCTFWYVNQYLASNETQKAISWQTKIGHFKAKGCQ